MNILLLAQGIYTSQPNGGSRFYKKLIELNPQHNFIISIDQETKLTLKNITGIFSTDLKQLMNSVKKEETIDVIDIPNWVTEVDDIILTIEQKFPNSKIFIGMHGDSGSIEKYSFSKRVNSNRIKELNNQKKKIEKKAYATYSLSDIYLSKSLVKRKILLDPRDLIKNPRKTRINYEKSIKSLSFIGRPDGVKGIDKYIRIVKKVHKYGYHYRIAITSGSLVDEFLLSIRDLWTNCADCKIYIDLEETRLIEFIEEGEIYIFPSRFDAFNLACLDVLELGKIAIISRRVYGKNYFITNYPNQLFFINTNCWRSLSKIKRRFGITNKLRQHRDKYESSTKLMSIYEQ
jgi:glycosyltransferase involved in cell wall biosynthesis